MFYLSFWSSSSSVHHKGRSTGKVPSYIPCQRVQSLFKFAVNNYPYLSHYQCIYVHTIWIFFRQLYQQANSIRLYYLGSIASDKLHHSCGMHLQSSITLTHTSLILIFPRLTSFSRFLLYMLNDLFAGTFNKILLYLRHYLLSPTS